MDPRNIGAGFGRQQGEGIARPVRHRPPQTGEAEPLLARLGELPFRFRRRRPRELEEMRGGHEAPTVREAPPLGAEVDDWRALGPGRREAPAKLGELDPGIGLPDHGRDFSGPDVRPRLKVGRCHRKAHRNARLAERFQIGAVRDVVAVVVAHRLA